MPAGDRRARHPGAHDGPRRQGLRLLPSGAAAELPGLPGDGAGVLLRVVLLDGEPRHLHDAGRRGAVDDLRPAHGGRCPPLRRRVRGVLRRAGQVAVARGRGRPMPSMHEYDAETEALASAVLEHVRARIADPVPLDQSVSPEVLDGRAGRTVTEKGLGWDEALRIWSEV